LLRRTFLHTEFLVPLYKTLVRTHLVPLYKALVRTHLEFTSSV